MEERMYSRTCCCRSVKPCMFPSLLNMRARVKHSALRVFAREQEWPSGRDLPHLGEDLSFERIGVAGFAGVVLLVGARELVFVVLFHEGRERLLVAAHEQLFVPLMA